MHYKDKENDIDNESGTNFTNMTKSNTEITYGKGLESPRAVVFSHPHLENLESVLNSLNRPGKSKFTNEEIDSIIKDVKQGNESVQEPNFIEIFSSKFKSTSVILTFLWFFCYSSLICTNFIFSFAEKEKEIDISNNNLILSFIYADLFLLPANFVGGLVSEIKFIKTSKIISLLIIIGTIFLCCSQLWKDYFEVFYGAYEFCAVIYVQLVIVYSTEIYPTRIRDVAIGYYFFIEKLGSIVLLIFTAQLTSIVGTTFIFYLYITIFLILAIISNFLKFDPSGKAIDQEMSDDAKVIESETSEVVVKNDTKENDLTEIKEVKEDDLNEPLINKQ